MIYFVGCQSIEEVEKRYRQWAKVLHSDTGGTDKEFQDMQLEYANIKSGKNDKTVNREKKVKQKTTQVKTKVEPEEMLIFAGNILTLVKTGIELAKEINTYIETDKELSNIKDNER